MEEQRPRSVTWAVQVLVGLVALGALAALLTVVLRDQLLRSWAEGHRSVRTILETQGLDAVREGPITPPAFVPVALVLFVVVALTAWVLGVFLREGYDWARWSTAVLVVMMAIATVGALRTSPPPVFVVLAVVSLLLEAALLVLLWHRDTTAYIRGAWLVRHEA